MVGDEEVDFLWRAEQLIVETDGAATHVTPTAFEEDRRRDAVHSMTGVQNPPLHLAAGGLRATFRGRGHSGRIAG